MRAEVAILLTALTTLLSADSAQILIKDGKPIKVLTPLGQATQSIGEAVITSDRAFVIEGETNSIISVGFDAKEESRIANAGAGGALLGKPVQMAIDRGSRLLVLDAQSPRIARFRIDQAKLTLLDVLKLNGVTGVSAICAMEGNTFVVGATLPIEASKLVHVIADTGTVQESFGDAFGPPGEVARLLYGASRLLCVPDQRLVVIASQSYPEIRAYDLRGGLRWKQTLPDYHRVSYREPESGTVQYVYPPDNLYDHTSSLFSAGGNLIALQIDRRVGRRPADVGKDVRTILLNASDGRIVGTQPNLPVVKSALSGRLLALRPPAELSIVPYSIAGK
jgi:hypothetical protein